MNTSRRQLLIALGVSPLTSLSAYASPTAIPSARIISGFAAGGSADLVCRHVAARLAPGYAGSVVVENRTGAAGQMAVRYIKEQAADGSSILQTPNSALTIYPHIYKDLPYDPLRDLAPVSIGAIFDFGFAVGPSVPVSIETIPEFLAWAKAHPGSGNFGSPGLGTTPHFIGTLLGIMGGTDLLSVPYRGTQPALVDMMGGNLSAVIGPLGDILPHLGKGPIRLLASTGDKRSRFSPEVPTLIEQGFKDMAFTQWYAFFLPAKASKEVIAVLNGSLRDALASQDVIDGLAAIAIEARSSTPAELTETLKKELATWGPIIQKVGFTLES